MKRREFIKKSVVASGSLASLTLCDIIAQNNANAFSTSGGMGIEEALYNLERGKVKNTMPEIRADIRKNPRAVFLIETHIDAEKDETGLYTEAVPQLKTAGKSVAERIFVKGSQKGGSTFIKPNFTFVFPTDYNRTTGVYSSPDFIGGVAMQLRDIGNSNIVAGEGPTDARIHRLGGVYDAFDEVGLDMIEAGYQRYEHYTKKELNWKNVEESPVWKRIPFIRPAGDEDNFIINISSMKCHMTALTTLTVKNLQGAVPKGYGQFCTSWIETEAQALRDGINFKRDFHRDYYQRVEASFLKHRDLGYKRFEANVAHNGNYDKYTELGGWDRLRKIKLNSSEFKDFVRQVGPLMRQEMWIHRGLDSAAAIKPDINIIEGIIAVDGEELHNDNIGTHQLVNMVIAGLSPFETDTVGTWLMGHDPKEIWYTRVMKERGLGENDIDKIDIYWIRDDGSIEPVKNLSEIKRHRIGLNWARKADPSQRLFW